MLNEIDGAYVLKQYFKVSDIFMEILFQHDNPVRGCIMIDVFLESFKFT